MVDVAPQGETLAALAEVATEADALGVTANPGETVAEVRVAEGEAPGPGGEGRTNANAPEPERETRETTAQPVGAPSETSKLGSRRAGRAMTGALPVRWVPRRRHPSASRSRGSVPSTRSLPILPRFTRTETGRIPQWRRAASSPSGSGRPRPTERRAATHPPRRSFHSAGSRAPRRTRARPSRRAARTAPATQTRFTTKPRKKVRVGSLRDRARAVGHQRRRVCLALPPDVAVHGAMAHARVPPRRRRDSRLRAVGEQRPRRDREWKRMDAPARPVTGASSSAPHSAPRGKEHADIVAKIEGVQRTRRRHPRRRADF